MNHLLLRAFSFRHVYLVPVQQRMNLITRVCTDLGSLIGNFYYGYSSVEIQQFSCHQDLLHVKSEFQRYHEISTLCIPNQAAQVCSVQKVRPFPNPNLDHYDLQKSDLHKKLRVGNTVSWSHRGLDHGKFYVGQHQNHQAMHH